MLGKIGIGKLLWIYDEASVLPSLALMSVWGMGNTMIIFLAGLQGVPRQLYEAAESTARTFSKRWLHITLLMVSSVIFFNLVMGANRHLPGVFLSLCHDRWRAKQRQPIYGVLPFPQKLFNMAEWGHACAIAWTLFVIVLVFTIIVFKTSPAWVYYEGEREVESWL